MELITSEYSWEQIIYKVIAWEGMDPWDLDITLLSKSFMAYITKMEELDFKVPAKYIIIAAVLLRMKSDHLDFIEQLVYDEQDLDSLEEQAERLLVCAPREGTIVNLHVLEVRAARPQHGFVEFPVPDDAADLSHFEGMTVPAGTGIRSA